jgi:hypothetical protein
MSDSDSGTTVELRQTNTEDTDSMAQFESPEGDAICASYIDRQVADQLGEYASLTISDEAEVAANLSNISGSGSGNYAVFETPGGAVTGLYISHDTWADALGTEVERDDDDNVVNAPESLGLEFSPSDEDSFEAATSAPDEEVEGLLAGGDGSDEQEADDSDDEEEVEISDEELGLVAEE